MSRYPDEGTYWHGDGTYGAAIKALYQRAFDEGKRDTPNPDWNAFVWWSRASHDITNGMSEAAALRKYIAQCAERLGIALPVEPINTAPAWPGQLRYQDGAYVGEDGQPVLIGSVHFGDGFGQYCHDPDRIREQLRQFKATGYSVVRVWINANDEAAPDSYWSNKPAKAWGPRSTPDYEDRLTQFASDCDALGLRLHTAAGDLIGTTRAQADDLFDRLANAMQRAGSHIWALCEGINEGRDTGGRDPREIERLINRVRSRHPAVLYALSAYTGHEDRQIIAEWTPGWMPHSYTHPPRGGHWWDKIRHLYSFSSDGEGEPVRRNGWHGEPSGYGHRVSAQDHSHELDDEAMALLAAMSVMARCNWTYLCSPGIVFDEPFESQAGYAATPRLLSMLPREVMRWSLQHSGPRFAHSRVIEAPADVRIDGAQSPDGRFTYCVYGPSGAYRLNVARSFTGTVIHPGTGESEPIEKRAGEAWTVAFTRGRVLIGHLT